MTLEVKVSGLDELNASLEMLGRFGDAPLTRALKSIGQAVVGQTIERFENEIDPDGNKWKRRKVETKKTQGRKILHGETGQLKRVTYIDGKGFVKIGAISQLRSLPSVRHKEDVSKSVFRHQQRRL